MSTCKDCIHYEICEIMSAQYGISKVPSSQCGFYKATADVVEVVRCKDCKYCHYEKLWNDEECFECFRESFSNILEKEYKENTPEGADHYFKNGALMMRSIADRVFAQIAKEMLEDST